MANIAGSLRSGIVDKSRYSTTSAGFPLSGAVRALVTQLGSNPAIYKNKGYYAAGSAWEAWLSVGNPSSFNPATGHGPAHFSQIQHEQVKA